MKEIVCRVFLYSGIFALWRYFNRNKIIILMIHGVGDNPEDGSWLPMWRRHGERQLDKAMEVLSKKYNFISMDDAESMLRGDAPVKPYSLVITFDDGYRDSVTRAMPILRKYNAPGIIYIATDYIEKREPYWVDRIDYALQKAVALGKVIEINGETIDLNGLSFVESSDLYKRLRLQLKYNKNDYDFTESVHQLANYLEEQAECSLSDVFEEDYWSALLRWDEIQQYSKEPDISFGSHTVGHFRLALIDVDKARDELLRSKEILSSKLSQCCRHFCYPAGSYNLSIANQLNEVGYASGVTCDEGLNCVGDDMMTLKRFNCTTTSSMAQVLVETSGLYQVVSALVKGVKR